MSFLSPKWDASQEQYVIETSKLFKNNTSMALLLAQDNRGNTVFSDLDALHNVTDSVVNSLIHEGANQKWFSKLPSHEQLMKRVRHTFSKLVVNGATMSGELTAILMTPKQLTFVWSPSEVVPPLYIDDSDSQSESNSETDVGVEADIQESNLPPVALVDDKHLSKEEYLLTRLRAAKARVETEQLRMMYFESTGRMPPDSDSEDE